MDSSDESVPSQGENSRGELESDEAHSSDDEEDLDYPTSSEDSQEATVHAPASADAANGFWQSLHTHAVVTREFVSRGRGISRNLKVFSIAMLPHARPELENGGKIILPPSFLSRLTQGTAMLSGPMLFKVTNINSGGYTHCGVLEFIADEGKCFMPFWMMHNIGANEGDSVTVESVTIPIATFALFQPQSVDFLDISNPKALLENSLRNFACITKGEIIVLHYNNRIYELKVLDTKPADAVNIIECDMNVDFAPPVGYVSPSEPRDEELESSDEPEPSTVAEFIPFLGNGCRLDGKETDSKVDTTAHRPTLSRGQPDFEWEVGLLQFNRKRMPKQKIVANEKSFAAFQGAGFSLKAPKIKEKDNKEP